MILVNIQDNEFVAEPIATTEDDGQGQIINKWSLVLPINKPKGEWDNFTPPELIKSGTLVEYVDKSYTLLLPYAIRYKFQTKEVVFRVF